jgi:hypothetical protein
LLGQRLKRLAAGHRIPRLAIDAGWDRGGAVVPIAQLAADCGQLFDEPRTQLWRDTIQPHLEQLGIVVGRDVSRSNGSFVLVTDRVELGDRFGFAIQFHGEPLDKRGTDGKGPVSVTVSTVSPPIPA